MSLTLAKCTDLAELLNTADPVLDPANRTVTRSIDIRVDGDVTTMLQLNTTHSKALKGYLVSVDVVGLVNRGDYTVTKSHPFEDGRRRRLPGTPSARHSERALVAADVTAMALLIEDPSWLENLNLNPLDEY